MRLEETLLKKLTEAQGVSGAEDEIRKIILEEIKPHCHEIYIDSMGNVIATKRGTGKVKLRVMVVAHMDEVGFMVTGIESNGTLRIASIGGIDNRILPALRVEVGTKRVPGVVQWKPIHLSHKEKSVKVVKDMRVDIGADSKGAAEGKVKVGDRASFMVETIELNDHVVRGKAFDDRAGCAELIELLKGKAFPFDLIAVFSVQEEAGLRGAMVLGEAVKPDAALILETTACHEIPQDIDEPDWTTVTHMGGGPVLSYMDRTSISHPGLREHFTATAKKLKIPFQYRSPQFAGGTDAGAIHTSVAGIPTLTMSLPCRYLHSPYCILDLNDFERGIHLARKALMDLKPEHLKR
jgi:tetrahedral aminopeptidase